MKIRDGFIGRVGNTPLIKLRRASEETGCTILGNAEFLQSRRLRPLGVSRKSGDAYRANEGIRNFLARRVIKQAAE
jgi:hypothetical protein